MRFLPATKALPKEMLPIVNKPLIEYAVDEAYEAGFDNFCFVTGRGKRAIEDHFDISYELEHQLQGTDHEYAIKNSRDLIKNCSFFYTRQNQMRGLGDAVYKGKPFIGLESFGVALADDLCINYGGMGVLEQLMAIHKSNGKSIIAVMEVAPAEVHKYGIVTGSYVSDSLVKVDSLVEKPQVGSIDSNLAVIGRYILTPNIFNELDNVLPGVNGEIQLTDALNLLASNDELFAFKFSGSRFDCGSLAGFVEANNYVFKASFA